MVLHAVLLVILLIILLVCLLVLGDSLGIVVLLILNLLGVVLVLVMVLHAVLLVIPLLLVTLLDLAITILLILIFILLFHILFVLLGMGDGLVLGVNHHLSGLFSQIRLGGLSDVLAFSLNGFLYGRGARLSLLNTVGSLGIFLGLRGSGSGLQGGSFGLRFLQVEHHRIQTTRFQTL